MALAAIFVELRFGSQSALGSELTVGLVDFTSHAYNDAQLVPEPKMSTPLRHLLSILLLRMTLYDMEYLLG